MFCISKKLRGNLKNAAKQRRQHARVHRRSSFTEDCLPPKGVLHQMSSSTKGRLPQKVVFHRRLSSTKGNLPPKVIFRRRLSSTEGCLPKKDVFHQRSSFTYHNTLVDLIFVRTVNIPTSASYLA